MRHTFHLAVCLALSGILIGQDAAITSARAEYKSLKAAYESALGTYRGSTRQASASTACKEARAALLAHHFV